MHVTLPECKIQITFLLHLNRGKSGYSSLVEVLARLKDEKSWPDGRLLDLKHGTDEKQSFHFDLWIKIRFQMLQV